MTMETPISVAWSRKVSRLDHKFWAHNGKTTWKIGKKGSEPKYPVVHIKIAMDVHPPQKNIGIDP